MKNVQLLNACLKQADRIITLKRIVDCPFDNIARIIAMAELKENGWYASKYAGEKILLIMNDQYKC